MTFNVIIVSAIILLGILFLLLEIFLLPGIGIAGIAGVIFVVGGVVYAYMYIGATAGNLFFLASAVLLGAGFFLLLRSRSLQKISLNTEIDSTVDNSDLKKINVGDTGVALSRLNPMGKVKINDLLIEGKSLDGELINEDSEVEVVRIGSSNIIVKEKNKE